MPQPLTPQPAGDSSAAPPTVSPAAAPEQSDGEPSHHLDAVKRRAEEYLSGWRRAKADYLNLKRESEQRYGELLQYAATDFILQVLPCYNNFLLTVWHIPDDQKAADWVKGLQQAVKGFGELLKTMGVEPVRTVGQPFDPSRHEAVEAVSHAGVAVNTVVEEISPGYTRHGHVLVPAKVKVAK